MNWNQDREARRAAYVQKLKDPRWQKLRLDVLQRDNWTCQRCEDTETTLHVHHFWYEAGREPWEYPLTAFITLCEDCHTSESDNRRREEQLLLDTIRRARFMCDGVLELATAFSHLDSLEDPYQFAAALEWHLQFPEFRSDMVKAYAEYRAELHRRAEARHTKPTESEEAPDDLGTA